MLRDIEDGCVTVGFNHYSLSLSKEGFILPRKFEIHSPR